MQKPRRVLLAAAAGALALTGTIAAVQADAADKAPTLTHNQALARLKAANVDVSSTGNCSDKNRRSCTSLAGIRAVTIDGVIGLKRASGCDITVTGGTEVGHSETGTYRHNNGYKADVSLTPCVTHYIEHHATRGTDRNDGAPRWTAPGIVYAKETAKHHWDITYTGAGTTGSSGTPSSAAAWPVLRDGAHGDAVNAAQSLLNASGARLTVDGKYGPATTTAVKDFQTTHRLEADGTTGPDTWNRLAPVLRSGAQGEAVTAAQRLLNASGARLTVDGKYGPATTTAVKDFQTKHHLEADGTIGPDTWKALLG